MSKATSGHLRTTRDKGQGTLHLRRPDSASPLSNVNHKCCNISKQCLRNDVWNEGTQLSTLNAASIKLLSSSNKNRWSVALPMGNLGYSFHAQVPYQSFLFVVAVVVVRRREEFQQRCALTVLCTCTSEPVEHAGTLIWNSVENKPPCKTPGPVSPP